MKELKNIKYQTMLINNNGHHSNCLKRQYEQFAPNTIDNKYGGSGGGGGGSLTTPYFFGSTQNKKVRANLVPPSTDATTLFIGNIPLDATIDDDVKPIFPNAISLRKPDGKTFAFVSFPDFETARRIVDNSNALSATSSYNIRGRDLMIGWATQQTKNPMQQLQAQSQVNNNTNTSSSSSSAVPNILMKEPQLLRLSASDKSIKTLFIRNLPSHIEWTVDELKKILYYKYYKYVYVFYHYIIVTSHHLN